MPALHHMTQRQETIPSGGDSITALILLLLPLLVLSVALIFVLIAPFIIYLVLRFRPGVTLSERDGPINVQYEEQLESSSSFQRACQNWAEQVDDNTRAGYELALRWCANHPPLSPRDTDITMPQFLGIQEKGVSAWSFDPAYESNQGVMVSARTELQFFPDSPGMATEEGGACTIQSNLPLPKANDIYYWESKIFSKPEATTIAIGLSTKPYPSFRFPGYCKHSVAIFSQDGFKCYNHPLNAQSYGAPFVKGDVVGVGFRPRTGSVFFTRNGVRMAEAFTGLQSYNLFPTISADGAAEVHVNFGQAGFVFIEANVKKWGLAPMIGTLAPPPAYGQDKDSVLIEACNVPGTSTQLASDTRTGQVLRVPPYEVARSIAQAPDMHRDVSFQGIRMNTLKQDDEENASPRPPPYMDAMVASSPTSMTNQTLNDHNNDNVSLHCGAIHSFQSWMASWRKARRDTSSGTPEAPSTELVGVIID